MSEKRYVLPAGMFAAFMCGYNICWTSYDGDERNKHFTCMEAGVKSVLRFLSENPIVPNHAQAIHLCETFESDYCDNIRQVAVEWQRIMFVAPEPETPKELDDLIVDLELSPKLEIPRTQYNADIIEAFRRGQKAGNR